MSKSAIATAVAFVFVALIIAYAIWHQTENGWWTAFVAIVGGALATAVFSFIARKIAEKRG